MRSFLICADEAIIAIHLPNTINASTRPSFPVVEQLEDYVKVEEKFHCSVHVIGRKPFEPRESILIFKVDKRGTVNADIIPKAQDYFNFQYRKIAQKNKNNGFDINYCKAEETDQRGARKKRSRKNPKNSESF